MNKRKEMDRLQAVLEKRPVDRPPVICPGGMMNMITKELMDVSGIRLPEAHLEAEAMAKLALASSGENIFENAGVPFCMTGEAEGYGARVDLGDELHEPRVLDYPLKQLADWPKLKALDLSKGRLKVVLDAMVRIKELASDLPLIGNLTGPVSLACSLIEPMDFYKAMKRQPEACHGLLDFLTRDLVAFSQAQIAAGADIIALSDPSATGEILGPKLFQEYAVAYINRVVAAVHEAQRPIIVHICGGMTSVFDQLSQISANALSFDSNVPLQKARQALGDRVLMGNVSTYSLEFGQRDKIRLMTKSCASGGCDILAPACGLGMRTSLNNLRAMKEALEEDYAEDLS